MISQFAKNGKESADFMKSVGAFLQAEEDLKDEVEKQQNNPWSKVWGKEANDFEAFLELSINSLTALELMKTE